MCLNCNAYTEYVQNKKNVSIYFVYFFLFLSYISLNGLMSSYISMHASDSDSFNICIWQGILKIRNAHTREIYSESC